MQKTILITGATDGIGLETAKNLVSLGHHLIIHGRNSEKLAATKSLLMALPNVNTIDTVIADLSELKAVKQLADALLSEYQHIDVLINNAGVFKTPQTKNAQGLDVRFVVNTIAPYYLSQLLAPVLNKQSRIVNLSSAAQSPVNIDAMLGRVDLDDMQAYAQSKLAIRLWTHSFSLNSESPDCISVNPGSLLASKMVKEGFGIAGNDLSIGANIVSEIALSPDMAEHNGQYFDNDLGHFATEPLSKQQLTMAVDIIDTMQHIINNG
ncbi:SDR family NAD(P)-dependent oxidoreductase [Psychromonas sp. SA13A]|uniref:SDR family NAD(P)-dependent oxidoreductase n=1 Tax=Psychromonas sp. SA13A TaxID=2686346 RepID=UPI00140D9FED|nr:SDR family NAD(P)-dependent oxidoreductase [Psychromonas sp. SA13A]